MTEHFTREVAVAVIHALPAPAVGAPDSCTWTPDADYETDIHYSACGEAWSFIEGGPTENNVRFCQGCGKPVVIASAQLGDAAATQRGIVAAIESLKDPS